MPLVRYIWLLLCYANFARSNLMEEFQSIVSLDLGQPALKVLPVALETDVSGCNCRTTTTHDVIVCFGFYSCQSFPKITIQSETLKVKSTDIKKISKGDTDHLQSYSYMEIDSNRNLENIEPYAFRNLSNLEHLSISYNLKLTVLEENVFVGLYSLTNLTLVSNGFMTIRDATRALSPNSIPKLQRLDLSENYFVTLLENDFSQMAGSNVTDLELVLCQTDYIHRRSFLPLEKLRSLHIGENNLNSTIIGEMLLTIKEAGIHLHLLDISRMGFRKAPPKKLLEIIANTTIAKLILAQNQFELMMNDTFPRMENLELLDLRQVLTINVEENAFGPSKFPNLKVLLLSGNNLSNLQVRLSTRMRHLDLSNNAGSLSNPGYFNLGPDSFRNMSHLEVLNLSYNRLITLYNFTFHGLDQLRIMSLKNGSIFRIEPYAFKPLSHLEMLSLENNPFLQNNENLDSGLFVGLNELKVLILSNCGLRSVHDDFFKVLPNLTHLILKGNRLISLTPDSLKPLQKLKVLDLSNNLLVSWASPLFRPSLAPIRYLGLNNNKITRFTVSMLEDIKYILNNKINRSVSGEQHCQQIELQGNVFVCDCNSMYVAFSWMAANGSGPLDKFFRDSQFTCTAPASWEHKRVVTYLSTYDGHNCSIYHSKVIVVIYTLGAIFAVLVVVTAGAFLYIYRYYISYWIFLAKLAIGRRHITKTAKELSRKTRFKYDAFVSYSSEDRDFIVQMISELEEHAPSFKLCVYERDFQIGSFISEAIHSSINDSRYIILIVSDHFAKSQWCRWETQLAEYHRLFLDGSYNNDPLILVRIGEVQPKHLTPTLKYLLKTKIYLNWEKDDKSQEFWNKLRNVLSTKS